MRHFGLRVEKKHSRTMEELFLLRIGYAEKQLWYPKYHLIVLSPPRRKMRKNIYVKFHFSKNQQQCANRMLSGEI